MGKIFSQINEQHKSFIECQQVFFVGTADDDGRVNISPKGIDSLRVLHQNRVVWLNITGSANETAAHLLENDRMTIMFCSFEHSPLILRLYGHACAIHPRDQEWEQWITLFPETHGVRQVMTMDVDLVQSSCGAGVPLFEYQGERKLLMDWVEKKGPEGIKAYWEARNKVSLDGKPTGILG